MRLRAVQLLGWVAFLAVSAASVQADPIVPALAVRLQWGPDSNTLSTWSVAPVGVPGSGSNLFNYDGSWSSNPNCSLTWDILADPDPFMSAVFGITNSAAVTQTFILTTTLPIAPAITPTSLVRGSTTVTLQDANNSGSALVADVLGQTVFTGVNDVTDALLLDALGVSGLSTSFPFPASASATQAVFVPGPAALSTIAIRHVFTLTPGDSVTLNSVYEVVPEPATLSLALVGLAGLALYGRKHRA